MTKYKTRAVQNLAALWLEWEPALMESIEKMPPGPRLLTRNIFQFSHAIEADVPKLLERLDNDPGTLQRLRDKMRQLFDALFVEEPEPTRFIPPIETTAGIQEYPEPSTVTGVMVPWEEGRHKTGPEYVPKDEAKPAPKSTKTTTRKSPSKGVKSGKPLRLHKEGKEKAK